MYRLLWIGLWASVFGLVFGYGAKRWSDRQGPYEVVESFDLPVSDYRRQWPVRMETLPERLQTFLVTHNRVDWLPLIDSDPDAVLYRALAGLAGEGDGEAALLVGLMSLRLEGAGEESVAWFETGADRGSDEAQLLLAELVLIDRAEGIEKAKAMKHLELAAATGTPGARVLLGVIHQEEGRPVMARQVMAQAAQDGEREALYHEALFNWNAVGREPEERSLYRSLQAAAEMGDVRAMHALGQCYESGIGVEPSYVDARRWNLAAADLGYQPAKRWCEARAL